MASKTYPPAPAQELPGAVNQLDESVLRGELTKAGVRALAVKSAS